MDTSLEQEQQQQPKQKRIKAWDRKNPKGNRAPDERAREAAHASREAEARDAEAVHDMDDEPWVNPASLPYIKPRPGMRQRWIRVSMRGRDDFTNSARRWREGWRPRRPETVPGMSVPRVIGGKFDGCIGVEGMVLCEMPEERARQRDEFFRKKRERQSASINQELARVSEHGSPAFGRIEKIERTQLVRERPAVAADNE